ncbi:MAG: RNA methyltransferase [Desulfuromonadaceae bacterium]|nr:RNA methyltransferase [Desulfuromonadaceae bacterium]
MKPRALALLHYPVLDRRGDLVASAVTNLDLHDLARNAVTFGWDRFYVVTPIEEQRRLAERIRDHWCRGFGADYNPHRKKALELIEILPDLETAIGDWEKHSGETVVPVLTGASVRGGISCEQCLEMNHRQPLLLLFGTGWGLAPSLYQHGWPALEPIRGKGAYNHLPVRSAAAIIMDRLSGSARCP